LRNKRPSLVIRTLLKPEYVYHPAQLGQSVLRRFLKHSDFDELTLAGGLPIYVNCRHHVGRAVSYLGVYDLPVSEALWRLLDHGEHAVDVGANIGYMTGLMAIRVGRTGFVISFEPQPNAYAQLARNVDRWTRLLGTPITSENLALSDRAGTGVIGLADSSEENTGQASLCCKEPVLSYRVAVNRLDSVVSEQINLLKVDVEGYELVVLRGAEGLLRRHLIRDIIFEEHQSCPSRTTEFLESQGYRIFSLGVSLRGPILSEIGEQSRHRAWEPRSCLATNEPDRAQTRMRSSGWRVLNNRRLGLDLVPSKD
jgi:FkbM family methyltransferase